MNCSNNNESDPNDITTKTKMNATENVLNDTGKTSGIYKIVNKVNGKYYVGSSKNIYNRWRTHIRELNKCQHKNSKLLVDWTRFGADSFEFSIVELIDLNRTDYYITQYNETSKENKRINKYLSENMMLPAILLIAEQFYLDIAKVDPDTNYQQCYSSDGGECTIETRNKIKNKLRGRILSVEHRRLIGLANTNRVYTQKTKDKIGNYSKCRKHSTETKHKISMKSSTINHDKNVYKFTNIKTNEMLIGTRNEFRMKYHYSHSGVRKIIRKSYQKYPKWLCELVSATH